MRPITTLLLAFLVLASFMAAGQDTHFSHIHASPMHNNPAWTGVFNADLRVITNYRNQWKTPTANFNTVNISLDTRYVIPRTRMSLNAGVSFLSDAGGDLKFGSNNYNIIGGMTLPIGGGMNFLTAGFQLGLIDHHIDLSNVEAIDEDPLLQSIALGNSGLDLSAGLGYFLSVSERQNIYAGAAIYHFNQPNVSILEDGDMPLYKRWVASVGSNWEFRSGMGIQPSILLYWQGPHREVNMGSYVSLPVGNMRYNGYDMRIYFGAWARYYVHSDYNSGFDAMIFSTRYDIDRFVLSFSFDLTLSQLVEASTLIGSPEISMIYTLATSKQKKNRSKIDCPVF